MIVQLRDKAQAQWTPECSAWFANENDLSDSSSSRDSKVDTSLTKERKQDDSNYINGAGTAEESDGEVKVVLFHTGNRRLHIETGLSTLQNRVGSVNNAACQGGISSDECGDECGDECDVDISNSCSDAWHFTSDE